MAKYLTMDAQVLRQKLDRTPLVIRSWLGSENVVDKIKSINQQYGFKDENQSIIHTNFCIIPALKGLPQYKKSRAKCHITLAIMLRHHIRTGKECSR